MPRWAAPVIVLNSIAVLAMAVAVVWLSTRATTDVSARRDVASLGRQLRTEIDSAGREIVLLRARGAPQIAWVDGLCQGLSEARQTIDRHARDESGWYVAQYLLRACDSASVPGPRP